MTAGDASVQPGRVDQEQALRAALRQSRWSLGLTALMLLGFVSGVGYSYYALEQGLVIQEDRILREAKQELRQHMDEIAAEAGSLVAETLPTVVEALFQQLEEDLPAYVRAFDDQSEVLIEHLAASLKRKARARFKEYLTTHRRILEQEFPEITDRAVIDRMVAEFERVFDKLAERYLVAEFRSAAVALVNAWKSIPPLPPRPGDPALAKRLAADLAAWAELKFTDAGRTRDGGVPSGAAEKGR